MDWQRKVKRVTRATVFSRGRSREVVIELAPPGLLINFRLKGERTWHALPVEYLYKAAVHATVRERKRQKAEEQKSKRRA